ncbi:hypothetical protein [Streptomyces sp. NPDC087525]|uniref:hypothetical protein n=1 Tax=Streptomyces sp. NPDC087525 TaxID=3365793 RepID=UPI0038225419
MNGVPGFLGASVLIEPYAYPLGAHHQHTLLALARARPGTVVSAPEGIARQAAAQLCHFQGQLLTGS